MEPFGFQSDLIERLGVPELAGRLVADDMGLGKTIEGLGIDKKLRHGLAGMRKTLIIAPKPTHYDAWQPTIEAFLGKATCVIDPKNRQQFIAEATDPHSNYEYYVTHYEAMRLMPELAGVPWTHVILDECHRIKNRKAQQTLAIKRLQTLYRTAMSGTPADNKPQDIWSILNWLYPKRFSTYWGFVKLYCQEETEEIKGGSVTIKKYTGVRPEMMPTFHNQIAPFYMRRLKEEVWKDLPEKYYSQVTTDLYPEQRKVYNDLRSDMLAWIGEQGDKPLSAPIAVAQLIRLQQAALASLDWGPNGKVKLIEPSAKLDDLVRLLSDEEPLPLALFTQSKSMANLTADRLKREGLRVGLFTGDTPDAERDRVRAGFQAGRLDVFMGTIKAGGEGITLTRSSTVGFLDRTWMPFRNKQAEDRLHRLGQKNAVQVIDFMARDTVDQRVKDVNIYKASNLALLLGDIVRKKVLCLITQALSSLVADLPSPQPTKYPPSETSWSRPISRISRRPTWA